MTATNNHKVLITTSGVGSTLGNITQYTNKALVKVGKKPVLSYIIESYPANTKFIVTLGHFGDQIKQFLGLVYPSKKIEFVNVDKYKGRGSNLIYSMLCAQKQLQCPFIYHACDTIITQPIPPPSKNWIGGFKGEGSSQYASFDMNNGTILKVYNKGAINPDFIYIGLMGINDYQSFWKTAKSIYQKNITNPQLNDTHIINQLIKNKLNFTAHEFSPWYDTGNVEGLNQAKGQIKNSLNILDKNEESIFIFKKTVIKFFYDKNKIKNRVKRANYLKGLTPKIISKTKNFYQYQYVPGKLYSEIANPHSFKKFLKWSQENLWQPTKECSQKKFEQACYRFYHDKTDQRIKTFLETRRITDQPNIINDEKVPSIKELLKQINFNQLCQAKQSLFHGDFILDNILKTTKGFCLLDWRQDFGGLLKAGDIYYDLGKLNHNLVVNHHIVNKNLFTVTIRNNKIACDILRKDNLVSCQQILHHFITKEKFDLKKTKILTALIWLNMAPLHHHPFDLFLFYFGKLNLWRTLNEK